MPTTGWTAAWTRVCEHTQRFEDTLMDHALQIIDTCVFAKPILRFCPADLYNAVPQTSTSAKPPSSYKQGQQGSRHWQASERRPAEFEQFHGKQGRLGSQLGSNGLIPYSSLSLTSEAGNSQSPQVGVAAVGPQQLL